MLMLVKLRLTENQSKGSKTKFYILFSQKLIIYRKREIGHFERDLSG